jgi:hypothetical protein
MSLFILAAAYLVTALGLVFLIDQIVGVMFQAPDENLPISPYTSAARLLRRMVK